VQRPRLKPLTFPPKLQHDIARHSLEIVTFIVPMLV
jgi:hypothetical protein